MNNIPWFPLAIIVIAYAFISRLQPISTDDLFFLLNTARWIIQHHQIPWTDTFSYTAAGQPWIYPVGGSLLFYAVWLIGGYTALCVIGASACALTAALLLRRGSLVSIILVTLAVPLIAAHCDVRADLFTTILAAAFLAILWHYHETDRGRLWLLPVLMIIWVNTHPGFILGLLLIAAYVGVEILEMPWRERRQMAVARLRCAWPWLLACIPVTPINPFGPWLYAGVYRLLSDPQTQIINEWMPLNLNWTALSTTILSTDPDGPSYLMGIVAVVIAMFAAYRRRFGAVVMLVGAATLALYSWRLNGFLGIVSAIVGTSVIAEPKLHWESVVTLTATVLVGAFAITQLSARLAQGEPLAMLGLGHEFPSRALTFIERESLPGEIIANKNGAFQVWRTSRRDYIDARRQPFGANALGNVTNLFSLPAPQWQHEVDRYGINVILATLDLYSVFPLLQFCDSEQWAPVYLDEVSVIFVRRTPENQSLISRLQIDCNTIQLHADDDFVAQRDATLVYKALNRYPDAMATIRNALALKPRSATAHEIAGEIYLRSGLLADAKREFLQSAAIARTLPNQLALAALAYRQGDIKAELDALQAAIDLWLGAPPIELLQREAMLRAVYQH